MKDRIEAELGGRKPSEIDQLNLDHCPSNGGMLEGITDEFVNLRKLCLNGASLNSLRGFPNLPKLSKLELADNRLSGGFEKLASCPQLASLNLVNNRIRDIEALKPLQSLENLTKLWLESNPIANNDGWRTQVFDLLPGLQWLDDHDRDGAENDDSEDEDDEDDDEEDDEDDDEEDDGKGNDNDEEEEDDGEEEAGDNDEQEEEGEEEEGEEEEEEEEEGDEEDEEEGPGLHYLQQDNIEDDEEEFAPGEEEPPSEEVEDDADEDEDDDGEGGSSKRARTE